MNQKNARVYDVFDVLVTNNINELLEKDDPALAEKSRTDYAAVRQEVDERMEFYRSRGMLATILLPRVREGLERTLRAGYRVGVYSNGTPENVRNILREGGIEELVLEPDIITADDVGPKDQPSSYQLLVARFTTKGLAVVSFADDGLLYCEVAALSGFIPEVYHVKPGGKVSTTVPGVRWVASVADIDK